jgi:hypothetical protein
LKNNTVEAAATVLYLLDRYPRSISKQVSVYNMAFTYMEVQYYY